MPRRVVYVLQTLGRRPGDVFHGQPSQHVYCYCPCSLASAVSPSPSLHAFLSGVPFLHVDLTGAQCTPPASRLAASGAIWTGPPRTSEQHSSNRCLRGRFPRKVQNCKVRSLNRRREANLSQLMSSEGPRSRGAGHISRYWALKFDRAGNGS